MATPPAAPPASPPPAQAAPAPAPAAAAATPPPARKKTLLFAIVGGVVLALAGVGAVIFLRKPAAAAENGESAHGKKDKDKETGKEEVGKKWRVTMPKTLVVNLTESMGTRLLKVSVSLKVTEDAEKELKDNDVQYTDFLREKFSTVKIKDVDTTAGRNALKRQIKDGVNLDVLPGGGVSDVYLTEFVIQ